VKRYLIRITRKIFLWLKTKQAGVGLGLVSFAESLFLPIITDPFLIAVILANRSRWLYYTVVAIVTSVLGGTVAYILGYWFFDTIGHNLLDIYGFSDRFAVMAEDVDDSGFVFVLLGALTPIPYKLVALVSGFVQINPITFVLASIFGRILRLGTVGFAAHLVGPETLKLMRKYLHSVAYILLVILLVYIVYSWL